MTLGGMLKHLARFEDDMSIEWLLGREQRRPGTPWTGTPTPIGTGAAPPMTRPSSSGRWRMPWHAVACSVDEALAEPKGSAAPSLRYILPNMIEEYARHNGHADLIRESVDGLVGHDPPE